MKSLWDCVLSKNTLITYETAVKSFKLFLVMNNLVQSSNTLPVVSEDNIILYIAHCYKTLKLRYTTIKLYLCGIRFAYLKAGITCPLIPTDSPSYTRIMTLLKAVKRIQGHKPNLRQPITESILDQICTVLNTGFISDYTDSLLTAVCLTAFFGFLRCGEFTVSKDDAFDPAVSLCLGDLTFHDTYVEVILKSSETDPFRHGVSIPLFKNNNYSKLCPFLALRVYLSKRNIKFVTYQSSMDPLFLTEEGHPLSRHVFMQHFKHILSNIGLDNTQYSGHSFRIGAASSGCAARLEDHLIKTLGRWSSDCYRTYIHTPKQVIQSAQMALLTELQSALS